MKKKKWLIAASFLVLTIIVAFFVLRNSENKSVISEKPEQIFEKGVISNIEVSTIAGDGVVGKQDGKEARFFQPVGVTSASGILYVTDYQNHLIRKIDGKGEVSSIAGFSNEADAFQNPLGGFQDGKAAEAQFNFPVGVAIDSKQNLYIADSENGAVRKISPEGEVTTITESMLYPFDLVINEEDEIFVSDALSHQIYQLSNDGTLIVLAGGGYKEEDGLLIGGYQDGQGEAAQFNEPSGLALTPSGNLLVADSGNQRIRLINSNNEVSTVAGNGDSLIPGTPYIQPGYKDGAANDAQFNFPKDVIAISDDQFFVADTYNHAIRFIQEGEVSTLVGTGFAGFVDGNQLNAQFNNPHTIALVDSRLIVADQYNHSIREIQFTLE